MIFPNRPHMCKKLIAGLLAYGLAAAPWAVGQVRGYLTVRVVEGDGGFNDMKRGLANRPVVEVKDEAGNPVEGATVSFTLPTIGPGGLFADGKTTCTVNTDNQGNARSDPFKPNATEGRYTIRVVATYQGKQGNVVIAQTNTLASGPSIHGGGHKTLWIVVAVAAGAGVGIALALSHKSSSSPAAATPTVLSSGGITIGAPQ
jgi:hypothetical protein